MPTGDCSVSNRLLICEIWSQCPSSTASTSSDEDGEIHMIQKELDAVDIQLKGFNYSDMDKMQVEEDCSV